MAQVQATLVKEPDPECAYGVGEIGLVPTASAGAGALHTTGSLCR